MLLLGDMAEVDMQLETHCSMRSLWSSYMPEQWYPSRYWPVALWIGYLAPVDRLPMPHMSAQ